jgi:hypothetical protein
MTSRSILVSIALGSAITALASAAGAQCYRHEECPADQLCIEQTCAEPDEPLDTCDTVDDCPASAHFLCDDGYCKKDGVYCQNPAGHCNVDNGWTSCGCEDGVGSAGEGGEEEPPPSDEELYADCVEILVAECGEDAPDINDECTPEQLETCEGYYDWLNQLRAACEQETEEVGFAQLAACCDDLEDGEEELQDRIDCVMALALEDCADLEYCWDDGEDAGDDGGTGSDADTDTADAEADTGSGDAGGCSLAPGGARPSSLLGLLLHAI